MNFADLLASKRVWGVVITGVVMVLAHFHLIVSTDTQAILVDQFAVGAQAIWTIVTKFLDTPKA